MVTLPTAFQSPRLNGLPKTIRHIRLYFRSAFHCLKSFATLSSPFRHALCIALFGNNFRRAFRNFTSPPKCSSHSLSSKSPAALGFGLDFLIFAALRRFFALPLCTFASAAFCSAFG